MITIEITGRVISKKNSRRHFRNRRTGGRIVMPSEAYMEFKEDALAQICGFPGLKPPYGINYRFEMKGKGATDVDNMMASINDILQDAGIIEDDKHVITGGFDKVLESKDYKTILQIWHVQEEKA